jgi:hypothetical protein
MAARSPTLFQVVGEQPGVTGADHLLVGKDGLAVGVVGVRGEVAAY